MRFLAVTGLQAALLALVTTGVIVALYFLKVRHRRIVIASSMLWGRVLADMQAQSFWEKFRRLISIIVAVLIALLIAMAAARPEVHMLTGGGERTLLVLDTSPTMLTRTKNGQTRWQRAVDAALHFVNSGAPSSEFRIADTSGRFDAAFTSDRRQIREAIEHMQPSASVARFPDIDADTTQTRFITDGVVPVSIPRGTVRQSVFEEAENVGITAFEVRSSSSSSVAYEAWLEVHNYGSESHKGTLTIAGSGGHKIERRLDLKTGDSFSESFDLSKLEGGPVRANIEVDGDALPLDNTAFAYLPVKRKTKTLLVTSGNMYLETLLQLDALVDVTTIKPDQYRPDPRFDVYIFDNFAPPNAPGKPSLLIEGTLNVSWLPKPSKAVGKPRFTVWDEDHPVMRFVSLHDVVVEKATRVDKGNLKVLAESEDQSPLILASDDPTQPRWILMTFSLQSSDFPLHPGFPLFIDNSLAWLSRETLAIRRQPGLVTVPISKAEIKDLNGSSVPSHAQGSATVFEAHEPGLYAASHEDERQYVAVNLASPRYSDVNRTVSRKDPPAALAAGWLQHELWFYMLGLAALLIGAEWFTYHRGITL